MNTRRAFDYLILAATVLLAWQGLHAASGELGLSSPARTVAKIAELATTPEFWGNVGETLRALVIAALIASIGGLVLGTLLGAHQLSGELAGPILVTFYSLPKIVLYPLLLLIFGLGLSAKVAFGALHGIFPMTIFAMNAVRNINPIYVRTARVLRLSPLVTARTILLPAVLPEILSGLRLSFALSLLGVIIGELFASQQGLGFMLIQAMGFHDVDTITAVAVLLAAIALAANGILLAVVAHVRKGPAQVQAVPAG
jgi:NitT/TauT family transport system permease protein